MHSNRYTFLYAIGISILTAAVLTLSSEGFRPLQEANIALDKKTSILRSVRIRDTEREAIEKIYGERVKELVVNSKGEELSDVNAFAVVLKDELAKPVEQRQLPLYIYTGDDGRKRYVVPMHGVGLWGPIWGYISIEDDFDTVYGSFFDHKSETPGLGAEISERAFQEQFEGKKIMSADKFVSVRVVKKAAKIALGPEHRVDGISGGTITSNGTDKMLEVCVAGYLGYFGKVKGE